ncbi:MAG: glycogen/starch/alpha-glucan family phosphorylase [Clostridia bacterium]|nr:glycogen/starch/alpha-glucan family phosphorylase [Clostridia bacterium]
MFAEYVKKTSGRELSDLSHKEIYGNLLKFTGEKLNERGLNTGKKKLYYVSAEFLIGKLLSANLINLGIYDIVDNELKSAGVSLAEIESLEPEPSLGNGGLGRLAACFMDSAATLGLPADGVGLCYHCGLFRQKFKKNKQTEEPDYWIEDESWLIPTGKGYSVKYGKFTLQSELYDVAVSGYGSDCNRLRLFDVKGVDENIIKEGINFDKTEVDENLTLFLYPDDSDDKGKKLRVYQQYFMVSNAAQLIIDEAIANGSDLNNLPDFAVVQINDTHPAMIIPELVRILTSKGIGFEKAVETVQKMCAYTNHTILAEALEKWPVRYLEEAVPEIMDIIRKMDSLIKGKGENTDIIQNDTVHMAHLAIHFSFSVNGVAALHTEILKNVELKNFYDLYPDRFNNKTNGITFRRWLIQANPDLTELIRRLTGDGFISEADRLKEFAMYENDTDVLSALMHIKRKNKLRLKEFLMAKEGIVLREDSIFDVQAKRLHEYKRQQLNALYIIKKYLDIKSGKLPKRHLTFIFAAKAAPAYTLAKDIIHLILCLSELIKSDPVAREHMTVVMIENYNVSVAEKLIPACDISEQISLASKEASGTGNMKFMLNGAVTLGTSDGANVEIAREVGNNNIYIFGKSADEVIALYKSGRYNPRAIYSGNPYIKKAVDFITDTKMLSIGDSTSLRRLQSEIITKDWFMTLLDFEDYVKVKDKAIDDYENRADWARKTLVNISKARYFSSDRTVSEYNKDIWKL